jgi:hypothetical protein
MPQGGSARAGAGVRRHALIREAQPGARTDLAVQERAQLGAAHIALLREALLQHGCVAGEAGVHL